MNLAGLLLIWLLYGSGLSLFSWCLVFTVSSAVISFGLLLLKPELGWYVGLSGVLHGLIMAGALCAAICGDRLAVLVIAVTISKVVYEQFVADTATAALIGAPVVVDAHLLGLFGGLVVLFSGKRKAPENPET